MEESRTEPKYTVIEATDDFSNIFKKIGELADELGTTYEHTSEENSDCIFKKINGLAFYLGNMPRGQLEKRSYAPEEYGITHVVTFRADTQLDLFLEVLEELKLREDIVLLPTAILMDTELYESADEKSQEIQEATQDATRIVIS